MSQPTEYLRQYSFSAFQTVNPDDPLPATKVDLELNAIKTTLDQIRTNLALIQRDDGEIANSTIGTAQIEASLLALGVDRPTPWATATAYTTDSAVFESDSLYGCLVAHTSGVFATDLAAAKWVLLVDFTTLVTDAEAAATAAASSASDAQAAQAAAEAAVLLALALTGGTMSGPIVTSGDATLATQAPRLSQIQSGIVRHATATGGTADVITTTHSPARTVWAAGMSGCFTATGANTTTTPSMNPDGIGGKTFLKNNLQALAPGDISGAGHEVEWEYNGTNLIIKNPSSANAYTVNGQTQETAPATGDFLGGYDLSGTAERKFSIIDVLEVTNLLTEDTTPDTAADFALVYDTSAGTVKKVKPASMTLAAATQAEQETGTSVLVAVTPGTQQFHPSAAKFWVKATGNSTTILASYNMTSWADTGVGDADGTIATDFSSANWCISYGILGSFGGGSIYDWCVCIAQAAGTFGLEAAEGDNAPTPISITAIDPTSWFACGFGDQ